MLRSTPRDNDTLFEIHYEVLSQVDQHLPGPRVRSGFAHNWLEALNCTKRQYGDHNIANIKVTAVVTRVMDIAGIPNRVYHYDLYGMRKHDRLSMPLPRTGLN